jgi:LCT (Lysosomal Cystine Transporter) family transporter
MKLCAVGTLVLVLGVFCVTHRIDALTMLTGLSLIKLAISTVKYIPQAHMNYTRQSTEGWSIGNVLLDFAGGVLSVTQMLIIAYNADDYSGFYGNPTKFLLGQVSVVFDVLFMLQHYVWYPQTKADKDKDPLMPQAPAQPGYSAV